jgi:uncharacterized SAM-binding protein YcdF (DUF218 family)
MKNRLFLFFSIILLVSASYLLVNFLKEAEGRIAGPGQPGGLSQSGGPDAIVVLTGGKGRVDRGLEFLRNGVSPTLILSGVNEAADLDSIFLDGLGPGERDSIILEKASKSTYENAVEVRRLATEKGYTSVMLVTSAYHMKRAYLIFRRVMPDDVRIAPHSVSSPNFDEDNWWNWKSLAILAPEFMKYSWYELRFGLESIIADEAA